MIQQSLKEVLQSLVLRRFSAPAEAEGANGEPCAFSFHLLQSTLVSWHSEGQGAQGTDEALDEAGWWRCGRVSGSAEDLMGVVIRRTSVFVIVLLKKSLVRASGY